MRRVQVFKYKNVGGKRRKVADGYALFHQWGCDYEEFEGGPGNYSTAIIEREEDGSVENVCADMIRFCS